MFMYIYIYIISIYAQYECSPRNPCELPKHAMTNTMTRCLTSRTQLVESALDHVSPAGCVNTSIEDSLQYLSWYTHVKTNIAGRYNSGHTHKRICVTYIYIYI